MKKKSGVNGQDKGAEHFEAFTLWAAGLTDEDARSIVRGGQLNRGEICRSLNCARSVLHQNPRVKESLAQLEAGLRTRGVLPASVVSDAVPLRRVADQQVTAGERLKLLEAENMSLRAALTDLRKRLMRFEAIDAHLSATGRLAI